MYENIQLPATWATKSYNNKPYYLVEVGSYSDEYETMENHFAGYEILRVERVQNPYQYGRYALYKLQKNSPSETEFFMPLTQSSKLEIALRYNCDYRRLEYTTDMFFPTVSQAVMCMSTSCNQIVVLQGLKSYSNHDSGRYPKYVVTYEPRD